MASANRGFFCGVVTPAGTSVVGVIGFAVPIEIFVFVRSFLFALLFGRVEFAHIEHRFGHDVLLGGPVAQTAVAAAFAAKGKVRVALRIGRRLANGAAMFHLKKLPTARGSPLAKSR